ncbi:MAG: Ig-like domain-containing protein [Nitrososphaerales archaeon]
MEHIKSLAISLGIILLSNVIVANAQPLNLTFLSLDPPPAEVVTGDEIVFSGTLTDVNGSGLTGKTVDIQEERATGSNVLASAITDERGVFSATWRADLTNPARDRIMSVSASFDGDDEHTASKSVRVGIRVAIQIMIVSIGLDKHFYFSGDRATFTIKFESPRGEPLDPESFIAIYDDMIVSFARENEGIYKFETPQLSPPKHTLQLVAEKHGYRVFTNAFTFDVFTRQSLPGIKLDFDWSPKQVLQGIPTIFTLSFTDTNNVVAPFVNYDFVIKKGGEVILELEGEQTTRGNATHEHTFVEGGKYTVSVKVNNVGEPPDLRSITLSSDFNIDVIKSSVFAVKVKSLRKDNAMRVTFRNPVLAPNPIYSIVLKFDDPSKVKIRALAGWDMKTGKDAIKIDTLNNPLEPGEKLRLRSKVEGDIGSIDWSAMDKEGKLLKSGTSKVRVIKFR